MQNTVRQNHRLGVNLSASSTILLAMFAIVSVLFGIEIFGIIFMYHSVDMRLQQTSALEKNMQSAALIQYQSDPLLQDTNAQAMSSSGEAPAMYPTLVREEQQTHTSSLPLVANQNATVRTDTSKTGNNTQMNNANEERKAQDAIMFTSLMLSTVCVAIFALFTHRRKKKATQKNKKTQSNMIVEAMKFFFELFASMFDSGSMDSASLAASKKILPIKDFQKTIIDPAAFPTISFNIPVKNETLHGSSSLQINVEDKNSYVDHVNLLVDNKIIGVLRNKPYTFTYDTTKLRNESWHRFLALAIDKYGTLLSKASIVVRIENKVH